MRGVLVYCADYHCGHSVALSADHCRPGDGISKCDVKGSEPQRWAVLGPGLSSGSGGVATRSFGLMRYFALCSGSEVKAADIGCLSFRPLIFH